MKLEEKILEIEFKLTWALVEECFKKRSEGKKPLKYAAKKKKKNSTWNIQKARYGWNRI